MCDLNFTNFKSATLDYIVDRKTKCIEREERDGERVIEKGINGVRLIVCLRDGSTKSACVTVFSCLSLRVVSFLP